MRTRASDRETVPEMNALGTASALDTLDDSFGAYAADADIVPPAWLTDLELAHPRVNVHCLSPQTRFIKRGIDILLGVALLVLLAPVMAVSALLVRLTSRGPVLFQQTRVGLNLRTGNHNYRGPERRRRDSYGKPFTLYKFRTMYIDAERFGARFAAKDDPRVTRVGWFLRRTRIDELPQLWNVLKGEMSIVGPRPERPEFIAQLSQEIPDYLERLGLKPGLTGVAQVVNGYDNDIAGFRRKVAYDLLYLQNCCIRNDFKIMFRTIRTVITGEGAL